MGSGATLGGLWLHGRLFLPALKLLGFIACQKFPSLGNTRKGGIRACGGSSLPNQGAIAAKGRAWRDYYIVTLKLMRRDQWIEHSLMEAAGPPLHMRLPYILRS
jgi:hypothetical protein